MKTDKTFGILIMIVGLLWVFRFGWLFYGYLYTGILWYYMFPQWVLTLNIIVGLIGTWTGYRLIVGQISIKRALVIIIPTMTIGISITYIVSA